MTGAELIAAEVALPVDEEVLDLVLEATFVVFWRDEREPS